MRAPETPDLLVPFDGSRAAAHVLRKACRTARRDGDRLLVLCVAMLPSGDEGYPNFDIDAAVMRALIGAQIICRDEGIVGIFKLSYAHSLADAILAEAAHCNAALIAMSLDEHERGESALMSDTVQSVLAAAPCTILLTDPAADVLPRPV